MDHLYYEIYHYFRDSIDASKQPYICEIYNVSSFYQLGLDVDCVDYICTNAPAVMKSDGFLSLSQSNLVNLLSDDSFFSPELDIYYGIRRYLDANEVSPDDTKLILKTIRLQLIPIKELSKEIRDSGLFEDSDIQYAISLINHKNLMELNPRGLLVGKKVIIMIFDVLCTCTCGGMGIQVAWNGSDNTCIECHLFIITILYC